MHDIMANFLRTGLNFGLLAFVSLLYCARLSHAASVSPSCTRQLNYITQLAVNLDSEESVNATYDFYSEKLGFTMVVPVSQFVYQLPDGSSASHPYFVMRIPGINTSTIEPLFAPTTKDRTWIEMMTSNNTSEGEYAAALGYFQNQEGMEVQEIKSGANATDPDPMAYRYEMRAAVRFRCSRVCVASMHDARSRMCLVICLHGYVYHLLDKNIKPWIIFGAGVCCVCVCVCE